MGQKVVLGSAKALADRWVCFEADLAPQTRLKFGQGAMQLCPCMDRFPREAASGKKGASP